LREALEASVAAVGSTELALEHVECFRPGKPEPIYRMAHDNAELVTAG
jgi:hypothetical protein